MKIIRTAICLILLAEASSWATYSILGYDPTSGEIGGAVQSCVPTVRMVLYGEPDIGMVATQGRINTGYGKTGLGYLRSGLGSAETVRAVHDGDFVFMPFLGSKYERQFAVMDRRGDGQAYTGSQCDPYAGHLKGRFCIAQGNLVENAMVVTSMVNAFERTPGHLSARLMAALEAAQSYGGDRRGMMSAAMLIVKNGEKTNQGVIVKLAADMSLSPLTDLRRKLKGPWLADYQAHQPQSSGNMSKAIRRPKQ
jgi:uncharacterized Ntn-hydrolase superfamily protein